MVNGESGGGGTSEFAVPTQVHADDTIVASKRRDGGIPTLRRAHGGMQQQKRGRLLPGIGEIMRK